MPSNKIPIAKLVLIEKGSLSSDTIVDGSASIDDKRIKNYEFYWGDGNITQGTGKPGRASHRYENYGEYDINLIIKDNQKAIDTSDPIHIIIEEIIEPLILTVPENITVESPDGNPVVVNYPPATTTGGKEPVVIGYSFPSGNPFPVGDTEVLVTANSADGQMTSGSFIVRIVPAQALIILNNSLPDVIHQQNYSHQLNAQGGVPPYTWEIINGNLPDFIELEGSLLSGPAIETPATYNFSVKVTDTVGVTTIKNLSITITPAEPPPPDPPPEITTTALNTGFVGVPYSTFLNAIKGTGTLVWSIIAGSLPSGLVLSSAGQISGTPTAVDSDSITFKVTDANGAFDTQVIVLNIVVVPVGGFLYYNMLKARADCVKFVSWRTAAEVIQYTPEVNPPNQPIQQTFYLWPDDPDPRAQDAMKIIIHEGHIGLYGNINVSLPASAGQSVMMTGDVWFGSEFAHFTGGAGGDGSLLHTFKEAPWSFHASGIQGWIDLRTGFLLAETHTFNLPPGGPYVWMTIPHALGKGGIVKTPGTWVSKTMESLGYPDVLFPIGSPVTEQRRYDETIAPMEQEFGVVGNRWTRFWCFFERKPSEDWISDWPDARYLGKQMSAYLYSLWGADTVRDPIRIENERIVGIPAEWPQQIVICRGAWQPGNAALPSQYPGRGDLIAYMRNWIVLHGTSKADVLSLLIKPSTADDQ